MKIRSSKTFVVKPAEKTRPRRSIPLSLLDKLYVVPHHNSTVHIYRPKVKVNAESLRESLSKTLVHFYPMAGRYVRPDGEREITEIDCNDEGVSYVEVETDSVLDDLSHHLSPSTNFNSLVPCVDNLTQSHVSSFPIMLVQVTYFRCGGVALGIAIDQSAVDGTAAFLMIKSWSEIHRGLDISIPPFLDRTSVICPRDPARPEFDHPQYNYPIGSGEQISHGDSDGLKVSVLRLTEDQLKAMKSEANRNQETNYTTFEALAGHTWRCVCKARGVAGDKKTTMMFPVSGRSNKRVDPQIPAGFFGNAVFRVAPIDRSGDLQSKPLWYAASKIHEVLARINPEYTRSVLDFLAIQPDLSPAKFGAHFYESPDFQITSWVGLGLNEADFGWGPPAYTGPGWIKSEKAYIFSSDLVDGGLSLAIGLKAHHMDIFEKLFYEFA